MQYDLNGYLLGLRSYDIRKNAVPGDLLDNNKETGMFQKMDNVAHSSNRSNRLKNSTESKKLQAMSALELLVCTAIIACLSLLLMPALRSARQKTQGLVCMSNMQQIAMAIQLYTGDNDGFLPGSAYRGVRNPLSTPTLLLPSSHYLTRYLVIYIKHDKITGAPYRCPANDAGFNENTGRVVYVINSQENTLPSYFFGRPQYIGTGTSETPEIPEHESIPKSHIKAAENVPPNDTVTSLGQIWMLTDADSKNYNVTIGSFPLTIAPPPHNNGSGRNYIFFDCHTEYRSMKKLPPNA